MADVWGIYRGFVPLAVIGGAVLMLAASLVGRSYGDAKRVKQAVASGLLGFACMAAAFSRYTVDDTYISLRYARNLVRGRGLVFSFDGSAPVEGYTNFLWVMLQAPLTLLGSHQATVATLKLVGIAGGLASLALVYVLARELTGNRSAGALAVLLLASTGYFTFWMVGGLETPLYVALLLAALYVLLIERRNGRPAIASGFLFALLAMTRPEGAVVAAVVFAAHAVLEARAGRGVRTIVAGPVAFLAAYGPYFAWRYSYYGYLLPNTFYAKTGAVDIAWGLGRLLQLSPLLAVVVPLVAVGLLGMRDEVVRRPEWALFSAAGVATAATGLIARVEWMPGFRYEVPALPFVCLLAAAGYVALVERGALRPDVHAWAPAAAVAVLLVSTSLIPARALVYAEELAGAHLPLAEWLADQRSTVDSFAGWDMGVIPYVSDVPTAIEVSPEGLLSNEIAHGTYDISTMFADIVVLPQPDGSSEGMQSFYGDPAFRRDYMPVFRVAFRPSYVLVVHARADVRLSAAAVERGRVIEERSFARYGLEPAQ